MKFPIVLATALAALVISGCGQKDSTSTTAAAPATGPRVVELTANDTMQYSMGAQHSGPGAGLQIEAKAGEQLKVILTNTGTQPKEVMGHNWVLLKAGSDAAAFSIAAASAKDTDYVPPALKDQVYKDAAGTLAHIETLAPRKSGEVTFTVPAPGEYPFLCSFPAHFQVGMKGTLIVK
jgi:azurin